jgi:phosphoglycerate dehydrogenase-like enzyme
VTRPVITYSGPVDAAEVVREVAGARFDIHTVPPETDAVASGLKNASAFLDASMKVRLTEAMIAAAPDLRLVVTATTGADHIDAAALERRGIPLLTLKGQRAVLNDLTPAAEHSWLLLMACARRLPSAHAHVLGGGWNRTDFPGTMLKGKTLGIVGCGRLGRWMARYGAAFGMRCRGYDPCLETWPAGIERAELPELLATSDFITLHVHLTPDNPGLLGRGEFARMKPGCIFVNTSRGELIDEAALLDGLRSGRIGAAGLDVLAGEPDVAEHPLRRYALGHDNLIITPHIAGYSPDAVRVVVRFSAGRIVDFFGAAR